MLLTGNPFVDEGWHVLTHLAGKDHPASLAWTDIRKTFGDGVELARTNSRLKSFTMVFGTNGPLTQPAYRKQQKNEIIYTSIMRRLLEAAEQEGSIGEPCELTGIRTNLDFGRICTAALKEAGQKTPERKWVGRDWIPLAGSLGNDAQALPAASRPMHVSATALVALQYLPLAVYLFQGRLTCYQSTQPSLVQQLVADVVQENLNRLHAGNPEILGKGAGTGAFVRLVMDRFKRMRQMQRAGELRPHTDLYLWLFSNSGAGADCRIVPIPDRVLRFLWEAVCAGFEYDIEQMLKVDPADSRFQFLECIRSEQDYRGLYAYKKWEGAEQRFYEFYQQRVCRRRPGALRSARVLANSVRRSLDKKKVGELQKPEAFHRSEHRNAIRKIVADRFTLEEYDALFPTVGVHPIQVTGSGWNLIRYYMSRTTIEETQLVQDTMPLSTHPKIELIATEYVRTRPTERVKKLLDDFARGKKGLPWLREIFLQMAEKHPGFRFEDWDEFVCNDEGQPIARELLFQLRLRLADLYREKKDHEERTRG